MYLRISQANSKKVFPTKRALDPLKRRLQAVHYIFESPAQSVDPSLQQTFKESHSARSQCCYYAFQRF